MVMMARTYLDLATQESGRLLEMYHGDIRKKPPVSYVHGDVIEYLQLRLRRTLSWDQYRVRTHHGRVARADVSYFVPDLIVVPIALYRRAVTDRGDDLDLFVEAMPLVVEALSPSTGGFDFATKLAEYQRRGDVDIWLLDAPRQRLTTHTRQTDGTYQTQVLSSHDVARPVALPGVEIDLAELFGALA